MIQFKPGDRVRCYKRTGLVVIKNLDAHRVQVRDAAAECNVTFWRSDLRLDPEEATQVDPYAGLDIDQASIAASGRSELPLVGTQIGYADISSSRDFHDFGCRLHRAGLELHDDGHGYTVRKRSEAS